MKIFVGDIVPVSLQVLDGNASLFPQAYVRDNEENLLTTLNLVHNANGEYIPSSDYIMPDEVFIKVQYRLFTDAGHTTPANYELDLDIFTKNLEEKKTEADARQVALVSEHDATQSAISSLNDLSLSQIVDGVWDEPLTGATHNDPTSAGRRLRQASAWLSIEGQVIASPTPTTTSFATNIATTTDSFYADQLFVFTSGALAGQARIVESYNGTTKTFTFDEPWTFAPSSTDEFAVFANHIHRLSQIKGKVDQSLVDYDGPTLSEMTAAFTEIKGAGWTTTDTLEAIRDALNTVGTSPADIWTYTTRTLTAGTKDTEIDAILEDTSTTLPGLITNTKPNIVDQVTATLSQDYSVSATISEDVVKGTLEEEDLI